MLETCRRSATCDGLVALKKPGRIVDPRAKAHHSLYLPAIWDQKCSQAIDLLATPCDATSHARYSTDNISPDAVSCYRVPSLHLLTSLPSFFPFPANISPLCTSFSYHPLLFAAAAALKCFLCFLTLLLPSLPSSSLWFTVSPLTSVLPPFFGKSMLSFSRPIPPSFHFSFFFSFSRPLDAEPAQQIHPENVKFLIFNTSQSLELQKCNHWSYASYDYCSY